MWLTSSERLAAICLCASFNYLQIIRLCICFSSYHYSKYEAVWQATPEKKSRSVQTEPIGMRQTRYVFIIIPQPWVPSMSYSSSIPLSVSIAGILTDIRRLIDDDLRHRKLDSVAFTHQQKFPVQQSFCPSVIHTLAIDHE